MAGGEVVHQLQQGHQGVQHLGTVPHRVQEQETSHNRLWGLDIILKGVDGQ